MCTIHMWTNIYYSIQSKYLKKSYNVTIICPFISDPNEQKSLYEKHNFPTKHEHEKYIRDYLKDALDGVEINFYNAQGMNDKHFLILSSYLIGWFAEMQKYNIIIMHLITFGLIHPRKAELLQQHR